MKIIHTADWHLGQHFYGYDRVLEHQSLLERLALIIKERAIDLLLIAGDIFDNSNPSAESQSLFYKFLYNLSLNNPLLQIIIIAGNHDSAARLEAPNPLLEHLNIYIRGVVKKDGQGRIDYKHLIIPLKKGGYCLAVPYLRQGDYPKAETYTQGVQELYQNLLRELKDKEGPIIAMGHLYMSGSKLSENDDSERAIQGGLESLSAGVFDESIDYTALGHLHRAQRIAQRENIRYSGAPIPMSFAEINNKQGVELIEINAQGDFKRERIIFEPLIKLLSIPPQARPIEEVLEALAQLPDGEANSLSPFVELKVLIKGPEPDLRNRIEQAIAHKQIRLARMLAIKEGDLEGANKSQLLTYDELKEIKPMDIARQAYQKKYGVQDMDPSLESLLKQLIEEVEL